MDEVRERGVGAYVAVSLAGVGRGILGYGSRRGGLRVAAGAEKETEKGQGETRHRPRSWHSSQLSKT